MGTVDLSYLSSEEEATDNKICRKTDTVDTTEEGDKTSATGQRPDYSKDTLIGRARTQ